MENSDPFPVPVSNFPLGTHSLDSHMQQRFSSASAFFHTPLLIFHDLQANFPETCENYTTAPRFLTMYLKIQSFFRFIVITNIRKQRLHLSGY